MRNNFVVLLLLILFAGLSTAQNNYNLRQLVDESGEFVKQPLKWNASDFANAGLIGAAAFLIMNFDEDIRAGMLKDRSYYKSFPIETGRIWGEPYTFALFASALAISGSASNNSANSKLAFEIAQSALYTGFVTQMLKMSFGRSRPFKNEGAFKFNGLNFFSDENWSLPSGHSSMAFSLSTLLSENAKNGIVKLLWYMPAIATTFSRVYQDKHWTSDVFLGAAIGFVVAKWVVKTHKEKDQPAGSVNQFYFAIPL